MQTNAPKASAAPPANLVLLGFMGTGKTAVGRILAHTLARPFLDMDAEIERRAGLTIAQIFAEYGESHFRAWEAELAAELAAPQGLIVAAGGGVVLNQTNLRHLETGGILVCLTARPETILRRIAKEPTRPLLSAGNSMLPQLEKIRQLLEQRQPLYAAIPRQVATDNLTPEEIAAHIRALCAL